jgi:NADH-quinone oxidoreductase subunit N
MNNASAIILELAVAGIALAILLIDLWLPVHQKKNLAYVGIAGLILVLIGSFYVGSSHQTFAFGTSYALDGMALFFKRFFLVAAIIALVISVDFADRISVGIAEFYSLLLFALTGMMFAASANDFIMVFVSLELITVTFYILNSFQRAKLHSLEAGVKYLILGALSTAFTVYGIAFIFGSAHTTAFNDIFNGKPEILNSAFFQFGLLMVILGLGFKIAAFPFHVWAPDVYEGSPLPATAFLAIGSKAAGFVLLIRILFSATPALALHWPKLFVVIAAVTILYGNLCAIPQRNLKRLLGYSSIGNAGYLLLGIAAASASGESAVLYYLTGYLFSVLAAFCVLSIVSRNTEDEDISIVAGLHQRSPLLAAGLAMAMISLAGIPPLAGFFGKFLLLKSVLDRGSANPMFYTLVAIALFGIVVSFYYYLGVVRSIYWARASDYSKIEVPIGLRLSLYFCIAGMLYLGLFPNSMVHITRDAVSMLKF